MTLNLNWAAGLKQGEAMALFSSEKAAVQWTKQFGNKMYVWSLDNGAPKQYDRNIVKEMGVS